MASLDFTGKCVFELGCGWGLHRIHAVLHGASRVVLQDLNREVLDRVTSPNAELNSCPAGVCEFMANAWYEITAAFSAREFDFVLASETISRKEQLPAFVAAAAHLVRDDGAIIFAAKRAYFGLSGTVADLIATAGSAFTHEVHEFKGSSAYCRDVVVLRRA